jgi:hypothetical protein
MAFLMFNDALSYVVGHPDGEVKLQIHLDVRDGDGRVCGIRLTILSGDSSIRQKIGIARRVFALGQWRHVGRPVGWIKGAAREVDGAAG